MEKIEKANQTLDRRESTMVDEIRGGVWIVPLVLLQAVNVHLVMAPGATGRLIGIFTGMLIVAIGALMADVVFRDKRLAYVVAALLILNPTVLQLSKVPTAESLVVIIFGVALLGILTVIGRRMTVMDIVTLAIPVLAISLVFDERFLLILPLLGLAAFMAYLKNQEMREGDNSVQLRELLSNTMRSWGVGTILLASLAMFVIYSSFSQYLGELTNLHNILFEAVWGFSVGPSAALFELRIVLWAILAVGVVGILYYVTFAVRKTLERRPKIDFVLGVFLIVLLAGFPAPWSSDAPTVSWLVAEYWWAAVFPASLLLAYGLDLVVGRGARDDED